MQKAKLQRSEDLLQAALHGAFVLGLITAAQPDAAKYRNDYLSQYFVKRAAEARASDQPRRDQVTSIVREETEAYWAQFPSSKLSDNAIAGRIMDRVNERLLAAMKGGLARIDNLTQKAIAKRIKALKLRTLEQASDQKTDG